MSYRSSRDRADRRLPLSAYAARPGGWQDCDAGGELLLAERRHPHVVGARGQSSRPCCCTETHARAACAIRTLYGLRPWVLHEGHTWQAPRRSPPAEARPGLDEPWYGERLSRWHATECLRAPVAAAPCYAGPWSQARASWPDHASPRASWS